MEELGFIAAVMFAVVIVYLVKRSRAGNKVRPRDVADKLKGRFK